MASIPITARRDSGPVETCLRERRQERSLSQGDLAQLLGVSRQTINAIETGRYEPSLSLALKLAQFFDCRVEDLFWLA